MKINVKQVLSKSTSVYKTYFKKIMGISLGLSFILLLSPVYTQVIEYSQTAMNDSLWLPIFFLIIPIVMICALIIMIKLHLTMPILVNSLFDENIMITKQAFQQTKGKFWRMIGCSMLIGILYLPSIAVTLFTKIPFVSIIGTIYMAFISSFFYTLFPMIAIEPKTNHYFRKSIKMIKGNYIPILLLTLLTVSALSIMNGIFANIFQGQATKLLILQVIHAIVYFFVYPFASITTIIVYRQLKSDPELFDSTDFLEYKTMYCGHCGIKITDNIQFCPNCGAPINIEKPKRKFYKAGFVLGILSFIPLHGLILGIIGLPMACISRRKSSIIMNCIGIVMSIIIAIIVVLSL